MGTYRKEWPCCGDVTETDAWEPEDCPFCRSSSSVSEDPRLSALAAADQQVAQAAQERRDRAARLGITDAAKAAPAKDAREEVQDELLDMALEVLRFYADPKNNCPGAAARLIIADIEARRASSVPAIPGTGREKERAAALREAAVVCDKLLWAFREAGMPNADHCGACAEAIRELSRTTNAEEG